MQHVYILITKNFLKPLLKVRGKAILDWLIEDIGDSVDQYAVISNHRFFPNFAQWAEGRDKIVILDDGTESNEARLGAVRDLQFAIEKLGIDDDLLVIAGDNLLDFSLKSFIRYAQEKQTTCIMRYWEEREEKLHKTGVAVVDEDDRILEMEEKPVAPKSHWCTPPFYFYKACDVDLSDRPGNRKLLRSRCTRQFHRMVERPNGRTRILDAGEKVQHRRFGELQTRPRNILNRKQLNHLSKMN